VPIRLNPLACLARAAVLVVMVPGWSGAHSTPPPAGQAATAAPQPQPGQSAPPKPLPAPMTAAGEPTSLQETYEDWVVVCGQREGKKVCALTQQQTDRESRQRILAVELTTVTADKAEGTLVLPFGLAVSKDVVLQMDGAAFGAPLRFRTCITGGCLVALSFDAQALAALRKGTALTIAATAENGQPVNFSVSLKGIGNGLTRAAALLK